jgi:hypothetical protein
MSLEELQKRAERLEARAKQNNYAQSWYPAEHADHPRQLIAVVTGYSEVTNDHGPTKILNVTDLNGVEWGVWLIHTGLRMAIEEHQPKPGQMISLQYQGKKLSKASGYNYHAYNVTVEDPEEAASQDFAVPAPAEKPDDDIPF